jgi:hypothetical protein
MDPHPSRPTTQAWLLPSSPHERKSTTAVLGPQQQQHQQRQAPAAKKEPRPSDVMKTIGPSLWASLHQLTFLYPEVAQPTHRSWSALYVESMRNMLPCKACQQHFAQILQETMPIRNGGRDEFSRWAVDVHNLVNARLGKPLVSYEDAKRMWDKGTTAVCPDTCVASTGPTTTSAREIAEGRGPGRYAWVLLLIIAAVLLAVGTAAATGSFGRRKQWRAKQEATPTTKPMKTTTTTTMTTEDGSCLSSPSLSRPSFHPPAARSAYARRSASLACD